MSITSFSLGTKDNSVTFIWDTYVLLAELKRSMANHKLVLKLYSEVTHVTFTHILFTKAKYVDSPEFSDIGKYNSPLKTVL